MLLVPIQALVIYVHEVEDAHYLSTSYRWIVAGVAIVNQRHHLIKEE